MKHLFLLLLFFLAGTAYCPAASAHLVRHGTATQLVVDGQPFLILGGELGNSSATCADDIDRLFPRLRRMGLNTVLVPAYWEMTEPAEGAFDFTLTDHVLSAARANDLHVVFLWFGAWKNSMSCYAPAWFKADYKRFPRAQTATGKPLEIASAFSEEVFRADSCAFTAWLRHIAQEDGDSGTVVMVQVENEIGMLEEARDHSAVATAAFRAAVPDALVRHLKKNKATLHPHLAARWAAQGNKTKGTWQELFGDNLYTDEMFMAWHYARYVQRLVAAAQPIYDIPYYVNAAMNSRGRQPGEYPSAGPLAHLIDIWQAAAPSIAFLAPDLYDLGFAAWVEQYHLPNNPLFIPEVRLSDSDGVRAFYVFGEHDAIGISPFSIEDARGDRPTPLTKAYGVLRALSPLLARYQGQGNMHGLLFDKDSTTRLLYDDDLTLTCRHYLTLPWDGRATDGTPWPEGGGIIIRLSKYDYLIAGSGIVVEFAKNTEKAYDDAVQALGEDGFALAGESDSGGTQGKQAFTGRRQGLAQVEEVAVSSDGTLVPLRRENGDQTHQGRHVRISIDDVKILHVQLYEY